MEGTEGEMVGGTESSKTRPSQSPHGCSPKPSSRAGILPQLSRHLPPHLGALSTCCVPHPVLGTWGPSGTDTPNILPGEPTGGPGGPGGPVSPRGPKDPCREKSLGSELCLWRPLPANTHTHTHTHSLTHSHSTGGGNCNFLAPTIKHSFPFHILTSPKSKPNIFGKS